MSIRLEYFIQYLSLLSGIGLNILLLTIVLLVPNILGGFKRVLSIFCIFELIYATVSLVVFPEVTVYKYRIVAFSRRLLNTGYSAQSVGIYCAFYQFWMVYVAIMFLYKYIVICHESWSSRIKQSCRLKLLLGIVYSLHLGHSLYCGITLCTMVSLPKDMNYNFVQMYHGGIEYSNKALVLTILDAEDHLSFHGFGAVFSHFLVSLISVICIAVCGRKLGAKITEKNFTKNHDYKRHRQIFMTLIYQACTPIIFYFIPTCLLVFHVAISEISYADRLAPYVTIMFSLPKVLDPLGVLLIIKEYRREVVRMIRGPREVSTKK